MQIRIRILLLIKVMLSCEHWSADPPGLHFVPPRLHSERPRPSNAPFLASELLNFDLHADPHFTLKRIRISVPKIIRIRKRGQLKSLTVYSYPKCSVGDPKPQDPHVFGQSGSISQKPESGSFPFLVKVLSGLK